MRISTNTMYDVGSARISELQSDLAKMNQQASSTRRIMTPEDDPVGAARALVVTQAQSVNEQFGINRRNAQSALNAEVGALQSITTLLQSAQDNVVHAGNGTLTDTDRGYLATELRGRYEELLGLANTKDGTGNTVFAGYQTSSEAFEEITTTDPVTNAETKAIEYKGDQGQRMLQVDTSRKMAMSDTGEAVFGSGDNSVFKALDDIIKLLENPKGSGYATDMTSASTALNKSYENILDVHASVGTRLKELDSLDDTGADRDLQYQTTLSQLQDLDMVKSFSDITRQKFVLEAAQLAYVKTTSLSLFNYIR